LTNLQIELKLLLKTMKATTRGVLAQKAGVSLSTFMRWLQDDQQQLQQLGVKPYQKTLPPKAVRYICEKYDIEAEE